VGLALHVLEAWVRECRHSIVRLPSATPSQHRGEKVSSDAPLYHCTGHVLYLQWTLLVRCDPFGIGRRGLQNYERCKYSGLNSGERGGKAGGSPLSSIRRFHVSQRRVNCVRPSSGAKRGTVFDVSRAFARKRRLSISHPLPLNHINERLVTHKISH